MEENKGTEEDANLENYLKFKLEYNCQKFEAPEKLQKKIISSIIKAIKSNDETYKNKILSAYSVFFNSISDGVVPPELYAYLANIFCMNIGSLFIVRPYIIYPAIANKEFIAWIRNIFFCQSVYDYFLTTINDEISPGLMRMPIQYDYDEMVNIGPPEHLDSVCALRFNLDKSGDKDESVLYQIGLFPITVDIVIDDRWTKTIYIHGYYEWVNIANEPILCHSSWQKVKISVYTKVPSFPVNSCIEILYETYVGNHVSKCKYIEMKSEQKERLTELGFHPIEL